MNKCPCKELIAEVNRGVERMRGEGAPNYIVGDYEQEMFSGQWVGCENCIHNDYQNFLEHGEQNIRKVKVNNERNNKIL